MKMMGTTYDRWRLIWSLKNLELKQMSIVLFIPVIDTTCTPSESGFVILWYFEIRGLEL